MIKQFLSVAAAFLVSGGMLCAQQPAEAAKALKADAYYHFALAHYYAEYLSQNGNRGDALNKAIENYKAAIKDDPTASFVAEELTDLYIQSGRIRDAVSDSEEALKRDPNDLAARRILARLYTRLISEGQQNKINEGMLKKAIEQYEKITSIDPKDMDSLLWLARLYKASQNSVDAEKTYKKALALDAENEDALTGLALVYADLGDNKRAADMLRQVSEKNPTARNLIQLSAAYEQMNELDLAAQTLNRAVDMNPPNASDLRRQVGRLYLKADKMDEGLKTFEALAADDPQDAESWLRISQIYRQKKNFTKAREAADKARAVDSNNLEIRMNDVALLVDEGKMDDAIQMMKGMVDQSRKATSPAERAARIELLERLGILYRSAGKTDEAVDTFQKITPIDPDLGPKVSAQVVETLRQAKDFQKADKESLAAMDKYPNERLVIMTRANLLADLGKYDEAVTATKKLLNGKDDRETYITLAQLYEKGKRFDEMGKAIDEAEKLSGSKEEKVTAAFMRGAMYERMKKFEPAEVEFRKVITLDPNNAGALNYLGYMFADRNTKLPEALDLISRALKLEPGNGAYLDSLGWVYYRLNRLQEAEDALNQAVDKMGKDPTVHDHLGDVYLKAGKLKEAIQQWDGAIHEWENGAPADLDHAEMAKVQKKLENARVRLARENRK